MRFSMEELLAGLLATTDAEDFSADPAALVAIFERIGTEYPLLAPFAAAGDSVPDAFAALEAKGWLTRTDGRYTLTETGRASCVSSKRTLFNKGDVEQLEQGAKVFAEL